MRINRKYAWILGIVCIGILIGTLTYVRFFKIPKPHYTEDTSRLFENHTLLEEYKTRIDQIMDEAAAYSESSLPTNRSYRPKFYCKVLDYKMCKTYMNKIGNYYKHNKKHIDIVLFDDSRFNGHVKLTHRYTLSLATHLQNDYEEFRRTVIHELAHLTYKEDANSSHGEEKSCPYYRSIPLVCEYCLTGISTLTEEDNFSYLNANEDVHGCTIHSH